MVKTTYHGDEEDSGDEDVEEEDNGEPLMVADMAMSLDEQDLDLDEFDHALNKMSITPKNSFRFRVEGQLPPPMKMPSRIRPSTSPESL